MHSDSPTAPYPHEHPLGWPPLVASEKYQAAELTLTEREQFDQDYRAVSGLLSQRIEREESSLYPLYRLDCSSAA